MNPKELISQIKDYADIADASYAMLEYVTFNVLGIYGWNGS
ncbi:hypothetical protein [Campylobacter sp. CNRCH_2014_2849]|nr:hypothetical protein [Campylobacter sp. CNRCH_2014_2849]